MVCTCFNWTFCGFYFEVFHKLYRFLLYVWVVKVSHRVELNLLRWNGFWVKQVYFPNLWDNWNDLSPNHHSLLWRLAEPWGSLEELLKVFFRIFRLLVTYPIRLARNWFWFSRWKLVPFFLRSSESVCTCNLLYVHFTDNAIVCKLIYVDWGTARCRTPLLIFILAPSRR